MSDKALTEYFSRAKLRARQPGAAAALDRKVQSRAAQSAWPDATVSTVRGILEALLPPFAITIEDVSPTPAIEGHPAEATVKVSNNTKKSQSVGLQGTVIPCDGRPLYTAVDLDLGELPAHAERQVTFGFTAPDAGLSHQLSVTLLEHNTDHRPLPPKHLATHSVAFGVAALFQFTLNSVHCTTTRALLSDHLIFATCGCVIPQNWGLPYSSDLGNVSSGDTVTINRQYTVPVLPSKDWTVAFSYAFANSGFWMETHGGATEPLAGLISAFTVELLEGLVNFASTVGHTKIGGDSSQIADPLKTGEIVFSPLFYGIFAAINAALSLNCDGVVVVDGQIFTGEDLFLLLGPGQSYAQENSYQGSDSPVGCGKNSDYDVAWSITRVAAADALVIIPAGASIAPNQTAQFTVSPLVPVNWSLEAGSGKIDQTGRYHPSGDLDVSSGVIRAVATDGRSAKAYVQVHADNPKQSLYGKSGNGALP